MNYNLPQRFLSWVIPIKCIAGALGMGALSAGGAALGNLAEDKEKIKRVEPPERKFANAILMLEAARGMTGKLNYADELEQNRLRSLASQERQRCISSILRYCLLRSGGKVFLKKFTKRILIYAYCRNWLPCFIVKVAFRMFRLNYI